MSFISNYSLKNLNTFGIDVNAKLYADVSTEADLEEVFGSPLIKENKLLVLGGGSNMLFTKDYDGLVLKISIKGIQVTQQGDDVLVTAGAGEVWDTLVKYCVAQGYAGLENLTLIPGTVGASPIQNIGAYGVEIKDVFESCTAFEIATGEVWLGQAALGKQLVDELKTSDEYLAERAKKSELYHLHYAERKSLPERIGIAASGSVDRVLLSWWSRLTQQRFW